MEANKNNVLSFPKRRGLSFRNYWSTINHYKTMAYASLVLNVGLLALCYIFLHMLKEGK